jgi:hypothetical protein
MRVESSSKKKGGNQMANKSYASSEIGGDESQVADPEFSKDFNSAYAKVGANWSRAVCSW